jgi:peptidoglycan/LPS O-acetylase OafA/YrhL
VDRRHDLDALRAFAMLLGIGLHAALSFFPIPWYVQDTQQNVVFGWCTAAVHGFRMPLFFLISGFFTMMLFRRRGLMPLLRQRATRILLPCLLGLVTIVPLLHSVAGWVTRSAATERASDPPSLADAVRTGDRQLMDVLLEADGALDEPDVQFGITPLGWAVLRDDDAAVQLLLARGAQVNAGNRDGSTPLHCAAFLGRHELAAVLLDHGADARARNHAQDQPIKATTADWTVTSALVGILGLPQPDPSALAQGRSQVRELLASRSDPLPALVVADGAAAPPAPTRSLRDRYQAFLSSSLWRVQVAGTSYHLIQSNVFDHLWFLWYLCWLVGVFTITAVVTSRTTWWRPWRLPVLSAGRFAWLIPLTLAPQWFMGLAGPAFGPDTATGLIPPPHLLFYYLVFFGFGALYFDADDVQGRLGRWWWLALPVALLVAFPLGLTGAGGQAPTAILQVMYAWFMIVGLMGLFRILLRRESRVIRYVSDASYWLYLTHLPLIIFAQATVRTWRWQALSKFLLISVLSVAVLLVTYQLCVRYTWIGLMLNGRRSRGGRRRGEHHAGAVPGAGGSPVGHSAAAAAHHRELVS